MFDLIERQKAIDAVFDLSEKLANEMLFIDAIVEEIENLPSAEQERKKGTWIKDKRSLWSLAKCSLCGYISVEDRNFCPNCGADMRLQNT